MNFVGLSNWGLFLWIPDGLILSIVDVVLSLVSSIGNGMSVVEVGLFPFFPNDFSSFVGILVSLRLYL
jgi:hypothetical protein